MKRSRKNLLITLTLTFVLMTLLVIFTARVVFRTVFSSVQEIGDDKATAITADLENYLENYEQIKPPTGECNINGDTVDVPAEAYTISPNESGRMQAHLGKYTLYDFGGKKKS